MGSLGGDSTCQRIAKCPARPKHTGDTPASLIPTDDGVAPALDAIYKGRNTFDVALVLDKSGSMMDEVITRILGAVQCLRAEARRCQKS